MNQTDEGAIVFIPLGKGQVAFIDFEDFDKKTRYGTVRDRKWALNTWGYPYVYISLTYPNVALHNFVLDIVPKKGWQTHHKNGNKLDARKSNLEVVHYLAHYTLHRSSHFIGVTPKERKWSAFVKEYGITKHLGAFKIEELAALVRDRWVVSNTSSAPLNFPNLSIEERQTKIEELLKKEYNIYEPPTTD